MSAHAVTRPFSQLYGVRLQDRLPPCTSKICVRSPGRSSSVGPSGSPRPRICVCVPKWMVSRPFTELLTGKYRVPVGVFLPVRLCGRGRRHTRRRAGSPARNHIVMHLTGMALDIVQESPWQNAWRPPDCQCFALCETGELMKLFSHLPLLVYNDSSPWFGYLTRVYRTAVPLPFNLRNLIMFYPGLLPTNTHRCETNPWSKHGNASQLPQCADQNCSSWLRQTSEANADMRYRPGWAAGSAHIWTPIPNFFDETKHGTSADEMVRSGAERSRLRLSGRNLFAGLQSVRNRTFYANDSWVEVMRVESTVTPEGNFHGYPYGCWFWPMPGSGIFINIGKSLRAQGTGHAVDVLGIPRHDLYFANATRAAGFDSLQVLMGQTNLGGHKSRFHVQTGHTFEIIIANGACMTETIYGACAPMELRTGWDASLPCNCSNDSPILNCRGSDSRATSY